MAVIETCVDFTKISMISKLDYWMSFRMRPVDKGRPRYSSFMPGPVTYVNDSISSQRRVNLDEYIRKLIALPPYIAKSPSVKALFTLREGDVESAQPTSALPQPHYRDPKNVPQARYNSGSATSSQAMDPPLRISTGNISSPHTSIQPEYLSN